MPVPFAVIGLTLFFILAIFFNASTETAIIMLIIFIAAFLVSVAVEILRKNKVLPVAFATGATALLLLILFNTFIYEPQMTFDGNIYDIKAQITDYPEQNYGNFYYPATVVSANGNAVKIKTRILLKSPADVEPYDYIEGNFKFYRLGQTSDEILASYKASGTYLGAYSVNSDYELEYTEDSEKPFMSRITALRLKIKESVYRILPNEYGSLAVALLLGDKSGLSDETLASFKNAGITHIICVSGLHLSIWGLLILKIMRKIGLNQRISAAVSIIPVVMLMLITGMNYSVLRSGIMMIVFLLSDIFLRQRNSLNSLGFALTVMAVADPFSMGSIGLQLSALSTLGIILCSNYIIPDVKKSIEKINSVALKDILNASANALLITSSAVIFTLPVSAGMSNGFSFAVFPSNLLIVWAAGYAMVLTSIGAFVGNITLSIFNLPGFLGGVFCKYIIKVTEYINKFAFLNIRISSEKLYITLIAVIIFTVFAFIISRGKKLFKVVSVGLCAIIFIFSIFVFSYFENSEMHLISIDVGNGTSVLATHKGKNILIGCGGTNDLTENKITSIVNDNGSKIDALILFDAKNSLADNLINSYSPSEIIYSENEKSFVLDDINIKIEKSDGDYAVLLESEDGSALITTSPNVDIKELSREFSKADIIISRSDLPKNIDKNSFEFAVINAEKARGEAIESCLAVEGIKCISTGEKGNVTVRCRNKYYSYERG